MIQNGLDGKIWLSDIGINKAIGSGLIRGVEPYPENKEVLYGGPINPGTIDLKSEDDFILEPWKEKSVAHSPLEIDSQFSVFGDLRSRVRRNGVRLRGYSDSRREFKVVNRTGQPFILNRGDRFCHFFIGGERDSVVSEFDHGVPLETKKDVEESFERRDIAYKNGDSPQITDDGYIALHASDLISLGAIDKYINPRTRESLLEVPEELVNMPFSEYTEKFGKFLPTIRAFALEAREDLVLSPGINLQLFYINSSTGRAEIGGIVDAGYEGKVQVFPIVDSDHSVKPGGVIAYARAVYFANGTARPYGIGRKSAFKGVVLAGSSSGNRE